MISEERIKELEERQARYAEEELNRRRLRILLLTERDLMNLFDVNRTSEMLSLGTFPALPKDYVVKSITWDYIRQSLGVVVWSMEFTSVEPGLEIPWWSSPMEVSQVGYRKVPINETISNNHANSVGLTNPSPKFRLSDSEDG